MEAARAPAWVEVGVAHRRRRVMPIHASRHAAPKSGGGRGAAVSPACITSGMPSEHRLRPATPADEPFLTRMLGHAANWREGMSNPVKIHYVEGFGRPGDVGVIAEVAGEPAGAAWCRLLTGSDRGYGYVA